MDASLVRGITPFLLAGTGRQRHARADAPTALCDSGRDKEGWDSARDREGWDSARDREGRDSW